MIQAVLPLILALGCLAGCSAVPSAGKNAEVADAAKPQLASAVVQVVRRVLPPAASTVSLAEPRDTSLDPQVRDVLRTTGYALADGNPPPPGAHRLAYSLAKIDELTVLMVRVDDVTMTKAFAVSHGSVLPWGALATSEASDDE